MYLEYARWLAKNGIARAGITGRIICSNQNLSVSDAGYVGTVTLTTDADLIRIPRSAETISGNTGGADDSYYYAYSDVPYPITLATKDKKTVVVEVKVSAVNDYLPVYVTLTKQKEILRLDETENGMIRQIVSLVPGEGFVFGLYNSEVIAYGNGQKLPTNTLIATSATNAQGALNFSGLYPHGSYYLKELSGPVGWEISQEKYPLLLDATYKIENENVIAVTLAQPIINKLIYTPVTLTKTDITGAEKLPGTLIEVLDAEENVIYREYTDENGEIPDIPVVPGTYTFRETYAPEEGAVHIVKTDSMTKKPLPGAEFTVTRVSGLPSHKGEGNGEVVAVLVTDKNGVAETPLLTWGEYRIVESKVPENYLDGGYDVTIMLPAAAE